MKPRVYVETSVIGYLTSWPSGVLIVAGRQKSTRDWWSSAKDKYDLYVSDMVILECSIGDTEAIRDRLAVMDALPVIGMTQEADDLATLLVTKRAVPATEREDAFHIALAVVNAMNYLVTWNFKHIANAAMFPKIYATCTEAGYSPTTICSPPELLGE